MSISKQAAKTFGLLASVPRYNPQHATVPNSSDLIYMAEDGLKVFKTELKGAAPYIPGEKEKGIYSLRHKMFKRDSPTKKRGKWVEVVTHIRGWKLARKYALKYNAELIRVS